MFCQTFSACSLLLVTLTCSGGLLASVGVCEEVQLIRTEKPKGFPDAWDHPQDTSLLDGSERSVNAILILARSLLSLPSLERFFPFSLFPTNRIDIPFAIRMSY